MSLGPSSRRRGPLPWISSTPWTTLVRRLVARVSRVYPRPLQPQLYEISYIGQNKIFWSSLDRIILFYILPQYFKYKIIIRILSNDKHLYPYLIANSYTMWQDRVKQSVLVFFYYCMSQRFLVASKLNGIGWSGLRDRGWRHWRWWRTQLLQAALTKRLSETMWWGETTTRLKERLVRGAGRAKAY